MKKLIWVLLLFSHLAVADITINALPLGNASLTGPIDSIPYWQQNVNQTFQLHLSDLPNLPAFQTQFALMVPSQFGNAGKCLGTNGTITSWVTCGSGGGSSVTVVNGGDAAYAIQPTDGHIRSGTPLTAIRTYTLDPCTGANIGETHSIKNDSTQGYALIVAGNASDTIDHLGTYTVAPGGALPVICAVSGDWDVRQ